MKEIRCEVLKVSPEARSCQVADLANGQTACLQDGGLHQLANGVPGRATAGLRQGREGLWAWVRPVRRQGPAPQAGAAPLHGLQGRHGHQLPHVGLHRGGGAEEEPEMLAE